MADPVYLPPGVSVQPQAPPPTTTTNRKYGDPGALNANRAAQFPGLQPDENPTLYTNWWTNVGEPAYGSWVTANPDRSAQLRALIWTYRSDPNAIIDKFLAGGFAVPSGAGSGGGGRGGGGGGGGGGASKAQQYDAAKAALRNRAGTLGLDIEDQALTDLAKLVVDGNWSNDMVDDHLVPLAQGTTRGGLITAHIDRIRQLGANQLLNVSDATAREYAAKIESGEMTEDAVRTIMATQAQLQHGWAAEQIVQGINVRDMLLPARDQIANELEMSPEAIDLMDSKWLGMVQTVDEKTGQPRAATMSEVITRARKDVSYTKTNGAKRAAAGTAQMVRTIFEGR